MKKFSLVFWLLVSLSAYAGDDFWENSCFAKSGVIFYEAKLQLCLPAKSLVKARVLHSANDLMLIWSNNRNIAITQHSRKAWNYDSSVDMSLIPQALLKGEYIRIKSPRLQQELKATRSLVQKDTGFLFADSLVTGDQKLVYVANQQQAYLFIGHSKMPDFFYQVVVHGFSVDELKETLLPGFNIGTSD